MTDPALHLLLAQHACSQAIIRFATLTDAGEFEALVQLFCEDAEFARPSQPDQVLTGRSNLLAALTSRAPRKTRHLVSNIEVSVTGPDTAYATSSISLYAGPPGSEVAAWPVLIGRYEDTFICQEGRWLFRSRKGTVDFRVEMATL